MSDANRQERRRRASLDRKPWVPSLYPPRFFPFVLGWTTKRERRSLRFQAAQYAPRGHHKIKSRLSGKVAEVEP